MVPIETHAVRKKHYVCEGEKFYIARKEDGKFYYMERIQSNKYIKHFREDEHIIELKRSYEVAKSFPLQRIITAFSKPIGNPPSPFTAVFYKIISPISDDTKVKPHGNATKIDRPYYKTSRSVLSRVKSELEKGINPKKCTTKSLKNHEECSLHHHKVMSYGISSNIQTDSKY